MHMYSGWSLVDGSNSTWASVIAETERRVTFYLMISDQKAPSVRWVDQQGLTSIFLGYNAREDNFRSQDQSAVRQTDFRSKNTAERTKSVPWP